MKTQIKIKRVYDAPGAADGLRILIDRLWPRGVTKEKAALAAWVKNVAPSSDLRKWFGHAPEKWDDFQLKYTQELRSNREGVKEIKSYLAKCKTATLVLATKTERFNHAIVLRDFLIKQ